MADQTLTGDAPDRLMVRGHIGKQLSDAILITRAAVTDSDEADLPAADVALVREHCDAATAHLAQARTILERSLTGGGA